MLPEAPPLPIIDISRTFIQAQAQIPILSYTDRMPKPVQNSSLKYILIYTILAFRLTKTISLPNPLLRRQNVGQCGPGNPCPDGSCCNINGACGYGPENCGIGNCTLNCTSSMPPFRFNGCNPNFNSMGSDGKIGDATALCGKDSKGGAVKCPLNVCCSHYGYCGVRLNFLRGHSDWLLNRIDRPARNSAIPLSPTLHASKDLGHAKLSQLLPAVETRRVVAPLVTIKWQTLVDASAIASRLLRSIHLV